MFEDLDSRAMSAVTHRLRAVLLEHIDWVDRVHRMLNRCPDLGIDDCLQVLKHGSAFSRWYHELEPETREKVTRLTELNTAWKQLEQVTRDLAKVLEAESRVDAACYERFADAQGQFVHQLERLLEETCALRYEFDDLTSLMNQESFRVVLNQEHARIIRNGAHCALALVVIDQLAELRRRRGPVAGDLVLAEVAAFLLSSVRRYDTVCHRSDGEFLFCLPETSAQDAGNLMERLRDGVFHQPVAMANGEELHVTLSVGVARLSKWASLDDAIDDAESGVEEAKSKGGDQCVVKLAEPA